MQSRTANAKRNIKWALLQRMLFVICPFFIRAILISTFSSEYLGLSGLCTSILTVLNMAEMGFSSAVLFCLYKPVAENDSKTISALMTFFKGIYKCIGVFVLLSGSIVAFFLEDLIKGNIPDDINIYVVFYLFLMNTSASYLLWGYKSTLLLAHQRNDIDSKIITTTYFIQYLLQAVAILVFENYYFYAASLLISTLIANIIRKYIADRLYPIRNQNELVPIEQKKFIGKKVAGAFIQKICGTTRTSFGPIFVSMFLGLTQVAIYDNYLFIITSIKGTMDIIIVAITTSIGDSIARESESKNYRDLRKFTFFYSLISGICTVGLLCLFQPFMQIWMGEHYMFSFDTVILLCLYFYVLTIGDVRSSYIVGAGLWWEGRYRSVFETLVNIILICLLGYLYGVNGIICGITLSVLLVNFFWGNSILFGNYFKNESQYVFYKDTAKYFIVTTVACAVSFGFTYIVRTQQSVFNLIINLIICLLCTAILYFIVYRNSQFVHDFNHIIRSK